MGPLSWKPEGWKLEAHMRLDITGRHVEITPGLRQLITTRLKTLQRVLNDAAVSALVIVTKEKYRHKVEMVIHARGDHTLSGMGEGNSWPLAIRQASQKIEQQAKKLKGKWDDRRRERGGAADTPPPQRCGRRSRRRRGSRRPYRAGEELRHQADVRGRCGNAARRRPRYVPGVSQCGRRCPDDLVSAQGRQPRVDRA